MYLPSRQVRAGIFKFCSTVISLRSGVGSLRGSSKMSGTHACNKRPSLDVARATQSVLNACTRSSGSVSRNAAGHPVAPGLINGLLQTQAASVPQKSERKDENKNDDNGDEHNKRQKERRAARATPPPPPPPRKTKRRQQTKKRMFPETLLSAQT